jgi:hypothetical protein
MFVTFIAVLLMTVLKPEQEEAIVVALMAALMFGLASWDFLNKFADRMCPPNDC